MQAVKLISLILFSNKCRANNKIITTSSITNKFKTTNSKTKWLIQTMAINWAIRTNLECKDFKIFKIAVCNNKTIYKININIIRVFKIQIFSNITRGKIIKLINTTINKIYTTLKIILMHHILSPKINKISSNNERDNFN